MSLNPNWLDAQALLRMMAAGNKLQLVRLALVVPTDDLMVLSSFSLLLIHVRSLLFHSICLWFMSCVI